MNISRNETLPCRSIINHKTEKIELWCRKNHGGRELCSECGELLDYSHAGFIKASSLHIHYHVEPRESDIPYFLEQELRKGYLDGIEGSYHTPEGYFVAEEDPKGFVRFEASFPNKEKLVLPGQLF